MAKRDSIGSASISQEPLDRIPRRGQTTRGMAIDDASMQGCLAAKPHDCLHPCLAPTSGVHVLPLVVAIRLTIAKERDLKGHPTAVRSRLAARFDLGDLRAWR